MRETLLSLKDQVLEEQKRREGIDAEVRMLRAALLRCKEEVIVEREKLRSQAEALLARERAVLGSLVSQLEEARGDDSRLNEYAMEMDKVHGALKQLYASLRLRSGARRANGDAAAAGAGAAGGRERGEEEDAVAQGIESEAGWARLADALPAPLGQPADGGADGGEALSGAEYEDHENEAMMMMMGDDEDTASIIAALTGLRSEISSLLPEAGDA